MCVCRVIVVFFFKQKTAYEMRISDWSSDVCSSDLIRDKIAGRHWAEGDDEDSPLVVALSARGLSLGSATLMLDAMGSKAKPLTLLKAMIRRSGEPVIRQAALAAMKLLGQQFVMGESIDAAVKRADKNRKSGVKGKSVSERVDLGGG